jgi:exodeoxyribonuclease-5
LDNITLSPSQKKLIKDLVVWYNNPTPFITLGGYAGTGKTTVIAIFSKFLKDKLNIKIAFSSYTGKATRVLEAKLKTHSVLSPTDTISTIHSLIYEPKIHKNGTIFSWEKKKFLNCDLIIVDEASMVNKKIWNDLLSFKIPIIAIGDHGQLPPIQGGFDLLRTPHLKLEEIHRQAKNNPIIKLSMLLRDHKEIPVGVYSKNVKKISRTNPDIYEELEQIFDSNLENTLILCGYNSTRISINKEIRRRFDRYSAPEAGDKVICLKNNHIKNISNGMLGKIIKIEEHDLDTFQATIEMDNQTHFVGLISKQTFNSLQKIPFHTDTTIDYFDFGYALTTHKAQGSQASRVVVFEERLKGMDDDSWFRWLYTAITRAEKELIIIGAI